MLEVCRRYFSVDLIMYSKFQVTNSSRINLARNLEPLGNPGILGGSGAAPGRLDSDDVPGACAPFWPISPHLWNQDLHPSFYFKFSRWPTKAGHSPVMSKRVRNPSRSVAGSALRPDDHHAFPFYLEQAVTDVTVTAFEVECPRPNLFSTSAQSPLSTDRAIHTARVRFEGRELSNMRPNSSGGSVISSLPNDY